MPFLGAVLNLAKLRDVPAGVLECDELTAARQRNWIIKSTLPAALRPPALKSQSGSGLSGTAKYSATSFLAVTRCLVNFSRMEGFWGMRH
jgi:hypothetical protein